MPFWCHPGSQKRPKICPKSTRKKTQLVRVQEGLEKGSEEAGLIIFGGTGGYFRRFPPLDPGRNFFIDIYIQISRYPDIVMSRYPDIQVRDIQIDIYIYINKLIRSSRGHSGLFAPPLGSLGSHEAPLGPLGTAMGPKGTPVP